MDQSQAPRSASEASRSLGRGQTMSLVDLLSTESANLTPAERRTATVLLRDSKDVVYLSATEVAARAKVHESTVIRLAQKLGYDGYAQLRSTLRDQVKKVDLTTRAQFRETKGYQLTRLVEDEVQAMLGMVNTIDQDRLDELAATLLDARRVYIYGTPLLVLALERRLRRLGVDVVELPSEGRDLPERMITMGRGDVLFTFVLRETYPALPKLAEYAHRQGADLVVVSDVPGINLPVVPKHFLVALRGADATFKTLTVPIVLTYALELSMFHLAQARGAESLSKLKSLVEILGTPRTAYSLETVLTDDDSQTA